MIVIQYNIVDEVFDFIHYLFTCLVWIRPESTFFYLKIWSILLTISIFYIDIPLSYS